MRRRYAALLAIIALLLCSHGYSGITERDAIHIAKVRVAEGAPEKPPSWLRITNWDDPGAYLILPGRELEGAPYLVQAERHTVETLGKDGGWIIFFTTADDATTGHIRIYIDRLTGEILGSGIRV